MFGLSKSGNVFMFRAQSYHYLYYQDLVLVDQLMVCCFKCVNRKMCEKVCVVGALLARVSTKTKAGGDCSLS